MRAAPVHYVWSVRTPGRLAPISRLPGRVGAAVSNANVGWTGFSSAAIMNLAAFQREGGVLGTRSAIKAHRQSIKRRLRNRAVKSATKTAIKRATDSIAGGDIDAAREAVRAAISTLDRAAQKGVLHPNNAARRKSRLLLRYNASVAALQTPTEERPAEQGEAPSLKGLDFQDDEDGENREARAREEGKEVALGARRIRTRGRALVSRS